MIGEYLKNFPEDSFTQIAERLINDGHFTGKVKTIREKVGQYAKKNNIPQREQKAWNKKEKVIPLKQIIKSQLQIPITIDNLAKKNNVKYDDVLIAINDLKREGYNILTRGNKYELSPDLEAGGSHKIDLSKFENKTYKFGVVADNHLNSKFERLDVLNALYDIYEKEGIKDVYNGGNWVDGECRFNKFDIINHGITDQINYFVEKYPQRKGIITHFVAGDDHEGWWVQRERIDIGRYMEMVAKENGRNDLKYLGYVEYDIELHQKEGKAIMRIMHGGGGTAYALSYTPQKMVESFQGGEKPNILILGHYHKADYLYYRDVHIVQAGCTEDQTTFMRKKKIQAALGGWIIEFTQSKDGAITRFKSEWIPFFDKQYYHRKGYYK